MRFPSLLVALGLLPTLSSGVFAQAAPAPSAVTDALYRNDIGHTGYNADLLTTPLSLLWRNTTEASAGSTASPIAANGIVYFAAGTHVYAVRAADGSTLWKYPTGDATDKFRSTPTLMGGNLYIGNDAGDLDKIDAKTGNLVWSQKVGGAIQGAPVVQDGVIYVGSADYHAYAVGDNDTHAVLWSYLTNGTITAAPLVGGTSVYFVSADESLYCLAKNNGSKVWSLQYNFDPSVAPPVYADGTLFVVAGPTLYAVNSHSGVTLWSQQVSGGITNSPTVGPNFVGVSGLDGTISVFNRQGRLRWRDNLGYPSYAPPLLTANTFLVSSQHGVIYALDSNSGKLTWEYVVPASLTKKGTVPASTEVLSAPVLADGVLYLLSDDGTLSALQAGGLASLPPRVTVMTPTPGSTVAGTNIFPSGTVVAEESGINPTTVSLTLDGQAVQNVIYDANTDQVALNTSSPTVTGLGSLADGAHELVLKATDWHGNTVTQPWGFFVDNSLNSQDNGNGPDNNNNNG